MAALQLSSSTLIQLKTMMKCMKMILGMTCTPSCQAWQLCQHQLQQQTSSLFLTIAWTKIVSRMTGSTFLLSSQRRKFWDNPVWTPCLKVATLASVDSSQTHLVSHQVSLTPPSEMHHLTPQSARQISLASLALALPYGANFQIQRRKISTKPRIPWRMCSLQPTRSLSHVTIVCQSLVKQLTITWRPYRISRRWHLTWSTRQAISTTQYSTCASINRITYTCLTWPRLSRQIGGGL